MVKNEEKNVRRLFQSVAPWVDGLVLCDTGSTDGTVALATQLFKELGRPGHVYEYPWENFGKSRTRSFECFQTWVRDHTEWSPEHTWALLLDADMVLADGAGLAVRLSTLPAQCPGAQLPQRNGGLLYKNTRILRASAPWRCIGATHEYWGCDNGGQPVGWDSPEITDIGDGGCKADKFVRDARLLEEELEQEPTNVRTLFYLGQTYMSLGRNEDAVRMLTRRIELKGWEEEVYIAHLYKGDCLMHLGRGAEAVDTWLRGWQVRPHRTETALRLIRHYRQQPNQTFVASIFLEKLVASQLGETLDGRPISKPAVNRDILFVSHHDMKFPVWEELGILAFYTGHREAAQHRLERHILDPSLAFHERNRLMDLYRWYAWKLPSVRRVKLGITPEQAPAIGWLREGFWRHFNPTVRREGGRYVVNLRTANYETVNARHYVYRGHEGHIITRNIVVDMDGEFNVLTDRRAPLEVRIPDTYIVNRATNIHGIEDCRWIDERSLLGTSRQFNPSETNKMVRVELDYARQAVVRMKTYLAPVASEEGDCQKNWLPFHWEGKEVMVYKIHPFQVFSLGGSEKVLEWSSPTVTFDGFRGSAPPVPWSSAAHPEEAWLMVVHCCHYGNEGRRYYHRFLTLGRDLKPRRVSKLFTVSDEDIQYVSGLSQAIEEGRYVLTYGVNDSQAWALEVEAGSIESALRFSV